MTIKRAYTAGSDGLEGFYGVIVYANGTKEVVMDYAWVHNGANVERYLSEGNFDTREQAKAATRRRINKLRKR